MIQINLFSSFEKVRQVIKQSPCFINFISTAKGFLNVDLFVTQPLVNHSLTLKRLDYKNMQFFKLIELHEFIHFY